MAEIITEGSERGNIIYRSVALNVHGLSINIVTLIVAISFHRVLYGLYYYTIVKDRVVCYI